MGEEANKSPPTSGEKDDSALGTSLSTKEVAVVSLDEKTIIVHLCHIPSYHRSVEHLQILLLSDSMKDQRTWY